MIHPYIQEGQKAKPRHMVVQLLSTKDEEKILKSVIKENTYIEGINYDSADFTSTTKQNRRN